MPELALPEWNDAPHNPSQEYEVNVGDATLLVHFDRRIPYVRIKDDFLAVEAYGKKHLKPSVREKFFKDVRYLAREFAIQ